MNAEQDSIETVLAAQLEDAESVFIAGAAGFPRRIVGTLLENPELLRGREVTCAVVPAFSHVCPSAPDRGTRVFFASPASESAPPQRFTPVQYRQLFEHIRGERYDLCLLRLVRDGHGVLRWGMGLDFQPAAVASARRVLAEVVEGGPFVAESPPVPEHGDLSTVAGGADPPASPPRSTEVARRIGERVASLVRDGDCLQLGVGSIPDAVLRCLEGHRCLGCHSGMISDGVMRLVECGALDGSRKTLDRGRVVTGFVRGSGELEDWASTTDVLSLRPVDYTHDPRVLARQRRLVAINSAVEIDLQGQVNSEVVAGRQVSGVGGSVDFARGAALSEGGRSILALPSTARDGEISRIVECLPLGSAATLTRSDVDIVVTENGVAHLRGTDLGTRARRLAALAAEPFRDQLLSRV